MSETAQAVLWGRAAGRCQFNNCNRPLSRSAATQETRNVAEKAHIRAFSLQGPRGDADWPAELVNDVSNLMLLCHDCHVTIDRGEGPERYSAAILEEMKRRHEQRIEMVTAVSPKLSSHVVTYGTFVGEHQALPTFKGVQAALFPHRYPARSALIALGKRDGPYRDRDEAFWAAERDHLEHYYDRQVRIPIEQGEVSHLSVFALAPQPLLIELGVYLGDITPVDTYQLHREPAGWAWPAEAVPVGFEVIPPPSEEGTPALVLSLSATITAERVTRVLGEDAAIWTVTVPMPHNDMLKSRAMLGMFRETMRPLLDRIKATHGHQTSVHVFPAMPVSLAVELGRVRMPKADAPWVLYDEQQSQGGFVPAFTITSRA